MLYKIEDNEVFDEYSNVNKIKLGSGHMVYVSCNDNPYLSVEIDGFSFFNDAVIFSDYLILGNYTNGVYIINLKKIEVQRVAIEGYFGYFELTDDILYVLGCSNILAFDRNLQLIWKSGDIAVDGITLEKIENGIITVNCEIDPPGGWIQRKIKIDETR